jgi:hypothetical protein
MATWAEFSAASPDLARFGHERLHKFGVGLAFLATVRSEDGGPRVHPVCPILGEGRLFVSVPKASPKNADLRANPQYMLHAFPDEQDPEFSVRGRATLVTGAHREVAKASSTFATGVRDDEDVFELDIERADSTRWENWATPETYPVRSKWVVS